MKTKLHKYLYAVNISVVVLGMYLLASCKDDEPGSNKIKQTSVPSKWRDEVDWGRSFVLKKDKGSFKERKITVKVLQGSKTHKGKGGSGVKKIKGAWRSGRTTYSGGNKATIEVYTPITKYTDQHIKHEAVHCFTTRSGHPSVFKDAPNWY